MTFSCLRYLQRKLNDCLSWIGCYHLNARRLYEVPVSGVAMYLPADAGTTGLSQGMSCYLVPSSPYVKLAIVPRLTLIGEYHVNSEIDQASQQIHVILTETYTLHVGTACWSMHWLCIVSQWDSEYGNWLNTVAIQFVHFFLIRKSVFVIICQSVIDTFPPVHACLLFASVWNIGRLFCNC